MDPEHIANKGNRKPRPEFLNCNGVNINTYGIEKLTVVAGDGRIAAIVDSQVTFNGLQASYNVNLSGVSAVTVSGNSQVTINDLFIAGVGSAYMPL